MTPIGSAAEIRARLDRGEISSVELARDCIRRIEASRLNAFISVTAERALEQAEAADARIRAGTATPLTGVPIAHKDIFCTKGVRTTCGSKMLDGFVSPYDATVVEKLAAAGAVMVGKTNMDEFAMGSSSETSHYGPVRNPWDASRVPGGSSGGSAAAVAADLVAAATGTDTGGSIRQPAAFSGVSGLKPTYGRVSRWGMVAYASSLDQGGPLARSVADLETMLRCIEGFDPKDSTSAERPATSRAARPVSEIKVGLPREYFAQLSSSPLGARLADARRTFESLGVRFVDVGLPNTVVAVPTYYVIASAEASTNLARYDGVRYGHRCKDPRDIADLFQRSRDEGFGREVKRRILTGTYALSVGYYDAYYVKAQRVRRLIRDDFVEAFKTVDALLAPTSPSVAFPIGAVSDPIEMYQQDVFTVPASLAGIPAMSLPCGFHDGLPVGMQLMGKHFDEATLVALGRAFQSATDWHLKMPPEAT